MIIKPKSNRTKGIIASSFMVFALIAQPMYGAIAGGIAAAEEVNNTNIQQIATEPAVESIDPVIAISEEETLPKTSVSDAEKKEDTEKLATTENSSSSTNTLSTPALLATPVSTNVARNSTTNVEYDSLQGAINKANSGDTITLLSDITVTSQISINKTITIDGNGKRITADFTNSGGSNDAVIGVNGEGYTATIKNITLDGGGVTKDLHGLDVYISNIVLDNIVIKNTARTAVQLNGSIGDIKNITTINTAQKKFLGIYSFNVITLNKGKKVSRSPQLIIGGKNSHNEIAAHIRIESGSATDTNGQYTNGRYARNLINNINAPAIATPTQNQILDTNDVTISWNAITKTNSTQASVSYNYKIDNGTVVSTTTTSVTPNLANGTHTVAVQAVSASGLESAWSADRTFTVNANQPPTVEITSPTEGATVRTNANNKLKITGIFTDDVQANYLQFVMHGPGCNPSGCLGIVYGYGTPGNGPNYADAHGNFSYDMSVPADLTSGDYTIYVTGTDHDGGATNLQRSIIIDNTAPDAPDFEVNDKSGSFYTNESQVRATWNKPSEDTVEYIYSYCNGIVNDEYNCDNKTYTETVTNTSRTGDFNRGEGVHFMKVKAIDAVGNESGWSNVVRVTYDKTDPVVGLSAPVGVTNADKVEVMGFANDANMRYYACYITTNQPIYNIFGRDWAIGEEPKTGHPDELQSLANKDCITTWTTDNVGSPSNNVTLGSFDISGLPDGIYTIHMHAHDMAGNQGEATTEFTIDRTPPAITVIAPTGPFTTARPTITGTVDKDATKVEVFVDGEWLKTDYFAGDDTWSYKYTTDLTNGDHNIQVRATDAADNTGSDESLDQPGFAQATFVVKVPTPEVPGAPETETGTEAPVVTPPAGTLAIQTTTNPTATTEDATVNGEEEVLGTSTERERSASVLAATDDKTGSDNEWSIVNAIAAVITVLISIIALAGISKKQGKGKTLSAVTAIPAIGAVVAFFMLENLSSPMVFLNAWSWLFVGVLAVQVFIFAMTKQKSSDNE